MKRFTSFERGLFALVLFCLAVIVLAAADLPSLRVSESDGTPSGFGVRWLKLPNGSVTSISNGVATLQPGLGGVASVAGTANQVLVNGGTSAQTGAVSLSLPSLISTQQGSFVRTTSDPGAELTVTKTLNNASVINDVVGMNSFTFNDAATANRLSAQMLRFIYYRAPTATGQATAFDSMVDLIPVLDGNVTHGFNALSVEPNIGPGSMQAYTKIRLFGGGNATQKYGFVAEPDSGNNGFGVAVPTAQVDVKSDSATKVAAVFSSAASPTVPIAKFQVNGADVSAIDKDGNPQLRTYTHATLPASANGTLAYCSNCNNAAPCAATGSGRMARRENGAWNCD